VVLVIAIALLATLVSFWTGQAHAQTNDLTFTAETVTGVESVVPKLTWATAPAASSCTASGATNWTGTKPAAGSVTLPAITTGATYVLECTWAADSAAALTWVLPTTNTDGTPYTNPKDLLIRYRYGTTGAFTELVVTPPTTTTRTVTGFTSAGTVEFFVFARNSQDTLSVASNRATKTFTGTTAPVTRSVAITVNPRPSAVTGLVVQ
jgi:hypothetical protein